MPTIGFDPVSGTLSFTPDAPVGGGGGSDCWDLYTSETIPGGVNIYDTACYVPCGSPPVPGYHLAFSNLPMQGILQIAPQAKPCTGGIGPGGGGGGGGGGGIDTCPPGMYIQNGQCVPIVGTGGGGGGGIGTGTGGGGNCPQCGCVTCQCGNQSDQGKQCYQDSQGNYYWLGPNDTVPSTFIACDSQSTPGTGIITEQPQPIQAEQDLTCLINLPWGSPDWCQCAEQWRGKLTQLGALVRDELDSGQASGGTAPYDTVFHLALKQLPVSVSGDTVSGYDVVTYWAAAIDRMKAHLDEAYGQVGDTLLGAYTLKSSIECVESAGVKTQFGGAGTVNVSIGIDMFGMGLTQGGTFKKQSDFGAEIHFDLTWLKRAIDQLIQYFAPIGIWGIGQALDAYYANSIDDAGLACAFQANGFHPNFAPILAYAQREQPTSFDFIRAGFRGILNDQQVDDKLRGLGYIDPFERNLLQQISLALPAPSDLVQFMLRSIGDPGIVARFQLEDEFDQLFQGRIKEWAGAIGMPESVLRGYHAAHWVVPGPPDLATFYQRFGPGMPPAQALGKSVNVDDTDIDRALREQGISPFWRPFFVAAMFQPLSRFDLRFGYQDGVIDDEQLKTGYITLGQKPENADILVDIQAERKIDHLMSDVMVRAYIRNGVNASAVMDRLAQRGANGYVADQVMLLAEMEATANSNEAVVKAIASNYGNGGLSDDMLLAELTALGLDADQVLRVASRITKEKNARPKQIAAAELCKMYGSRLISRSEFGTRLERIGYTANDAELIIRQCEINLTAKQLKQEQQLLKQQAAAEYKQLKLMQMEERTAQLGKQRDARALAAQVKAQAYAEHLLERDKLKAEQAKERKIARAAIQAQKDARFELRMLSLMDEIADKWYKAFGGDPASLTGELTSAVAKATGTGEPPVEDLLKSILLLVEAKYQTPAGTLADLVSYTVSQLYQAGVTAPVPVTSGPAPPNLP
jgi:hypothetical protein